MVYWGGLRLSPYFGKKMKKKTFQKLQAVMVMVGIVLIGVGIAFSLLIFAGKNSVPIAVAGATSMIVGVILIAVVVME